MKKVGIFGTSGMAMEVGDIAHALGFLPVYIARDQVEVHNWKCSDEIITEDDVLRYSDMPFVIGIGDNKIRSSISRRFAGRLRFINLIHPSASFGVGQEEIIQAKQGVIVCAGVRFTRNIQVGDFCIFNLNATISHDVVIDECVYVAPGAHITGNVFIGARTWVGIGVAINQGCENQKLCIGNDSVIGSGAVVINDCEPYAVYVGVPAKKIK